MNQLIKITEQNGKQVVSARELHAFLESKQEFSNWIKNRIKKYGLVENQDYTSFDNFIERKIGATKRTEYALSLNAAKELSMVEGNIKGKQARKYFIACEKQLKENAKPLSNIEIIKLSIAELERQQQQIDEVKTEVRQIKAQVTTRPNYFTIVGYATLNGINCGLKLASSLGKRATALCKIRNVDTETIPDPRFGVVNTYPQDILDEIFNMTLN